MQHGTFIVLDGNDGSGKATQARLLSERLSKEGIPSEHFNFPNYSGNFFGEFLGECLAGQHGDFLTLDPKIASTLYAFDRSESAPSIASALRAGKVVIADRFTSSNKIHQGGKILNNQEREAFLTWLDRMEHEVLHIPRPDRILYVRVPVEISVELVMKKEIKKNKSLSTVKDMVEESRQYLERSYKTANWLAAREQNWTLIDCMKDGVLRSPESIHEDIWKEVQKAIS